MISFQAHNSHDAEEKSQEMMMLPTNSTCGDGSSLQWPHTALQYPCPSESKERWVIQGKGSATKNVDDKSFYARKSSGGFSGYKEIMCSLK